MDPQLWLLWGGLILLQNASFTTVSRARNSGSYLYHTIAAIFSNGVWFLQMFFVVDVFNQVKDVGPAVLWPALAFYVTLTVISSVATHWFLRTKVEKGNRRVGA